MYRVIGADGKEYGPFTADQVRQWMAQGRLNAQSQMSAEGSGEWKPLSQFTEFMTPPRLETQPPPYADQSAVMRSRARTQVEGPATALLVIGILNLCMEAISLLINTVGMAALQRGPFMRLGIQTLSGPLLIINAVFVVAGSIVIIAGALKMKKMESYGLSMAASIIAMIPWISPCCLLGIGFGIWSIVVLTKPHVKDAFQNLSSQ